MSAPAKVVRRPRGQAGGDPEPLAVRSGRLRAPDDLRTANARGAGAAAAWATAATAAPVIEPVIEPVRRTPGRPTPPPAAPLPVRPTPAGKPVDPNRRAPRPPARAASPVRTARAARRRRRPQRRAAFIVLLCAVAGSMVLGLVSLNALLAKASFRVDDLSSRIDALEVEHLELVSEQAELSAPGRIAEWARRNGMRLPDDIRLLHAPDASSTAPAGEPDTSGSDG